MYKDATEINIERIVSQYSPSLLRPAMTRLPSAADAEDAVQEVFLRLVSKRPRFRDEGHKRAWRIRATLQRETIQILRASAGQRKKGNFPYKNTLCPGYFRSVRYYSHHCRSGSDAALTQGRGPVGRK